MLAELTIIPLGRGTHLSSDLGRVLKIIDESGIRYRLTPSGTCIEGDWDEVISLVKKCHHEARTFSDHVLTTVRIEDELGANNKLNENISSIEESMGRQLKH
jgi:uncharacterized protein (TIGR00106 family)